MTKTKEKTNDTQARNRSTPAGSPPKRGAKTQALPAKKNVAARSKSVPASPERPKFPENSKANQIVKLLQRKGEASIAEIQKASGWQPHSVRCFLSGTDKKRLGYEIRAAESSNGALRYMFGTS